MPARLSSAAPDASVIADSVGGGAEAALLLDLDR
jgi:hypothetical protein